MVCQEVATGREGVKQTVRDGLEVKKTGFVSGACDWEDRSLAGPKAQSFKTQCALRHICQGRVVANGSSNVRPRICSRNKEK